jgi:hypothetical protein
MSVKLSFVSEALARPFLASIHYDSSSLMPRLGYAYGLSNSRILRLILSESSVVDWIHMAFILLNSQPCR